MVKDVWTACHHCDGEEDMQHKPCEEPIILHLWTFYRCFSAGRGTYDHFYPVQKMREKPDSSGTALLPAAVNLFSAV